MGVYDEDIEFVKQKLIEEGVPTPNPEALAYLMVLTAYYGAGDALAGWILQGICDRNPEPLKNFVEKVTGKKPKFISWVHLDECLRTLAKKYKIFNALEIVARTGGRHYLRKAYEEVEAG